MKPNNEENKLFRIGQLKDEKSWIKKQFDTERTYQLSYRKHNNKILDPSTMSIEEIIDYANINYIKDEKMINRENLIHDLIVFENYKDDLKYDIENNKKLFDFTGWLIAVLAGVFSIINTLNKDRRVKYPSIPHTGEFDIWYYLDRIKTIFIRFIRENIAAIFLLIIILLVLLFYKKKTMGRKSKFNRLKTVNQVVRVLTNIKEQLA